MNKRTLTAFLVFATILVCGLTLWFSRAKEPAFKGKTLLTWLRDLDSESPTIKGDAQNAIREWGTNAIPHLLALFETHDSWAKEALVDAKRRFGIAPIQIESQFSIYIRAQRGFEVLGSLGKPAIPALGVLLNQMKTSQNASFALAAIGEDSVPVLVQAFTNMNGWRFGIRVQSSYGLIELKTNAHAAVPALVGWLKDKDLPDRELAAEVLGHIGSDPSVVVPVLIEASGDRDWSLRCSSVEALGRFGSEASEAVPVLLKLATSDKEIDVRRRAVEALKKISPETATKLTSE